MSPFGEDIDPVVSDADASVRRIWAASQGKSLDVLATLYRCFIMGAVASLQRAGQPPVVIAENLRRYADQIERGE